MGLHWRCRAFVLNGQVSVEWSRCPGSMGRRARDSVVVWFFATKLSRLDACEDWKQRRSQGRPKGPWSPQIFRKDSHFVL